jgi:type IV pilus assembly protein PilF
MFFRTLIVLVVASFCAACVTETTIKGTDQVVTTTDVDLEAAAKARVSLGLKYLETGNTAQAKFNLLKALEYAPDSVDVHFSMAYYYQAVDEFDLAEQHYRKAVSLDPDNGTVRNAYGVLLCRQKKFDLADEQFRKAVKIPGYIQVANTYENAGICARDNQQLEQAEAYFLKALNHNPRQRTALLEAGELSLLNDNVEQSKQYLLRYLRFYRHNERSAFLALQVAKREQDWVAVRKYGGILTAEYPSAEQTKRYLEKDY